jgi:hypothetical protein
MWPLQDEAETCLLSRPEVFDRHVEGHSSHVWIDETLTLRVIRP